MGNWCFARCCHSHVLPNAQWLISAACVQVLLATQLKRTDSMISPQLFHFDDHFEFEEVIGRSSMSEVSNQCEIANVVANVGLGCNRS